MHAVRNFFQLRRTLILVTFIGLFGMASRGVLDPDVWYHLKTGEWIMQHHAVPRADPFSFTRAGQPWFVHEWFFDFGIYVLFRLGGYASLIICFAAIITVAFAVLYLRCRTSPAIACATILWGALACAVTWGVRAQVVLFLLLSIWLFVLERADENPKMLWWTLPLTILGMNLHAGTISGLIFTGTFLAGGVIDSFFSPQARTAHRHLLWLALALFGELALSSVNPHGFGVLLFPLQTLRVQPHITEWASPDFHAIEYVPFLLLIIAAFAIFAFGRRAYRTRDVLLLLITTYGALSSVRVIPFFVLIAAPLIARGVSDWLAIKPSPQSRSLLYALLNAGLILAMLEFAATHTAGVIRGQAKAEEAHFPAAAVAYLTGHPPVGRLFNLYDWGGYLLFKLPPQIPVFIDGRTEVYREPLVEESLKSYYLQDGWKKPLAHWKIADVLVPPDSALASALRESPEWSVSFEDGEAVIFSRKAGADRSQNGSLRTPTKPITSKAEL